MVYESRFWLKSYDPGVPSEIELEDESLPECFEKIRRDHPHRPALRFLGMTLSFERLMTYADRFAACLSDHGIGKGDVVAVSLPNSPQYLITLLGGLKAGCAVSGISPLHTAGEMAHQLEDSGARAFVVMDALFQHRLLGIADGLKSLELVCPTGLLDFLPTYKQVMAKWLKKVPTGRIQPIPEKSVIAFKEALSRDSPNLRPVALTREDPAFIQYTGGTTGVPKGAVCPHRNMLANVTQFIQWLQVEKGKDVMLSAYPMFHIAGLFTAIMGLAGGLTQVLIPNPRDTKRIVKEIAKYGPQWLANVPSLYLMLLKEPAFHGLDFSSVKYCVSGAAPFPVEAIKRFEDVVGAGKVIELYGMTETCVLLSCNPIKGPKKIGTVGLPMPSTKIRIMDLETGMQDVPLGEEGEIVGTGPQVMRCYHNKPEETALALREHDGATWMHTGDIGTMDEDGYVTIVDRKKDMISVAGFKVFPREVEEKLYEHPAVAECAVIGVPNPKRPETEIVKLVAQKSPEYADKPDDEVAAEILAFAREHLAKYKVPRTVEFREIPLTPAGKVDKKALRSHG